MKLTSTAILPFPKDEREELWWCNMDRILACVFPVSVLTTFAFLSPVTIGSVVATAGAVFFAFHQLCSAYLLIQCEFVSRQLLRSGIDLVYTHRVGRVWIKNVLFILGITTIFLLFWSIFVHHPYSFYFSFGTAHFVWHMIVANQLSFSLDDRNATYKSSRA